MAVKQSLVALVLALAVAALPGLPPQACPAIPKSAQLTSDPKLPDPFSFFDSHRKVETKAEWACRREEIGQLFQTYELGALPPRPEKVTGSLANDTLTVNVTHEGNSISFSVGVQVPTTGSGPFPAFIGMGGLSIPIPSDVAVLTFNNNDMALQNDATSRGIGKFYQLYGVNATASAMMAWVWGVSRIIDVLEEVPGHANLDLTKLAVSGCSRDGKGALVTGAFEERIALTVVQESGSGGAGCWRISDAMLAAGVVTQTASEIVQENVWFSEAFAQYVNDTAILPFDHHMLAGMVAPRGLLSIDNTGYDWLGPESVWGCMKTANKIYQALGIPDHMGESQAANHTHCDFPAEQQPILDAFIGKFLKGEATNTSVLETADAPLGFVDSDWIDWTVPKLH
ncbi:carbohydrate esterase family 15 protein [Sphaerobolus stellatus SS14]|uniref:(4-O-methyl)-D-glucuronate--lignin esterase n=1 Tax=Sphaerobolus stellatus (strain SS14) TaxID=990650 RepID=A0A0C9VL89_SPHS4|nr:carbohydrate esterase family 15 protein [Sphaerobolus stellatus SS14]